MSAPRFTVTPGGVPVEIHADVDVVIEKLSVGSMDNNVYLLRNQDSLVLVDAADDAERLLELTADHGPDVVVTTHRHHDHIRALAAVASARSPQMYAGTPDAEAITAATGVHQLTEVWDGDHITCGSIDLTVIGLVGHTPGSISLSYKGELLLTGDSLFPGGAGKTRSPQDFTSLMDDLEAKIFDRYGDDVAVHPGHGDSTTIGAERPHLAEWRSRGW